MSNDVIGAAGDEAFDGSRIPENRLPSHPIGGYEITAELGIGGQGIVFQAEKGELKRAIKVLHSPRDELDAERFEREVKFMARLDHENITKVHDYGVCQFQGEDRPYIVMELVDQAKSIAEHAATLQGSPAKRKNELLKTFQQACSGLQHAHGNAVIHRDLKPDNILVDATGRVKLTDFGIARDVSMAGHVDATLLQTQANSFVGTPWFMSPEQFTNPFVDVRSDVYSMAVVLFQTLTKVLPYHDVDACENIFDIKAAICDKEHLALDAVVPKLRGDMAAIVAKALEKEPRSRYQTIQEFSSDISSHLQGMSTSARPVSAASRLWRWARRNPALASVWTFAVALLLVIGVGGFVVQTNRVARVERFRALIDDANLSVDRLLENDEAVAWQQAEAIFSRCDEAATSMKLPLPENDRLAALNERVELLRLADRLRTQTIKADVIPQASEFNPVYTDDLSKPSVPTAQIERQVGSETRTMDLPATDLALLENANWASMDRRVRDLLLARLQLRPTNLPEMSRWIASHVRDPWHIKLREALVAKETKPLLSLAAGVNLNSQPVELAIVLANALRTRDEIDTGWRVLKALELRNSRSAILNFYIGQWHKSDGNLSQAAEYLRTAIALHPNNSFLLSHLAIVLQRLQRTSSAAVLYQRAIDLDARNVFARLNLAICLKVLGDVDAAIHQMLQVREEWPENAGVHYNLGKWFKLKRDVDASIESYRRAVQMSPGNWRYQYSLGGVLLEKGEFEPAIVALQAAETLLTDLVDLDGFRADTELRLAMCNRNLGDFEKAVRHAQLSVQYGAQEPGRYRVNYGTELALCAIAFADQHPDGRQSQSADEMREQALTALRANVAIVSQNEDDAERKNFASFLLQLRQLPELNDLGADESALWNDLWTEVENLSKP